MTECTGVLTVLMYFNSDQYYKNTTSMSAMRNVLVVTMPNTRNYTIGINDRNETVRRCSCFYSKCSGMPSLFAF